jgi:transcriptional regulator with XRE-family HTH domain/ribosomal protein L37E
MYLVGRKITQLRREQGKSQEQLATEVGVSRQAISKWERGEGLPDLYHAQRLAQVFHVNVDDLLSNNPFIESNTSTTEAPTGNYIKRLLYKAKNTTNSDEAKRIKQKLIKYGVIGVITGFLMIVIGFFSFAIGGFSNVINFNGTFGWFMFAGPLLSMFVFMMGGVVLSISVYVLYAGLGILVAEVATNYLDTREKCPSCGDEIDSDEKVCSSCGYTFEKEKVCISCGKVNQKDDKYCRQCGTLL